MISDIANFLAKLISSLFRVFKWLWRKEYECKIRY